MSRRVNAWLFACVLALAVAVICLIALLSSTAAADTGCVYSGGGWICAGEQPPSEPGELPTVEPTMPPVVIETPAPSPVTETAPPAPVVEETTPPVQSVCD